MISKIPPGSNSRTQILKANAWSFLIWIFEFRMPFTATMNFLDFGCRMESWMGHDQSRHKVIPFRLVHPSWCCPIRTYACSSLALFLSRTINNTTTIPTCLLTCYLLSAVKVTPSSKELIRNQTSKRLLWTTRQSKSWLFSWHRRAN